MARAPLRVAANRVFRSRRTTGSRGGFHGDAERFRAAGLCARVGAARMNLIRLQFRHFHCADPHRAAAGLVSLHHEFLTLLHRVAEYLAEHIDDVVGPVVIVVVKDDGVRRLAARLRLALFSRPRFGEGGRHVRTPRFQFPQYQIADLSARGKAEVHSGGAFQKASSPRPAGAAPPVISKRLSEAKSIPRTGPRWRVRLSSSTPVRRSHSFTSPVAVPLASVNCSVEPAKLVIRPRCPCRANSSLPVASTQTRIEPPRAATARRSSPRNLTSHGSVRPGK